VPVIEIGCSRRPCGDVITSGFVVPNLKVDSGRIRVLMVTESPPADPADGFWAKGDPFFLRTTRQAFADAGYLVATMRDIVSLGVYLTTAIKCPKRGYGVEAATIEECSHLLEKELDAFPKLESIVLLGDVAIKAINVIARRRTGKRAIPAGPTYRVREGEYWLNGVRLFPSYLTTGKSFLIEASKRRMAAEDIGAALGFARAGGGRRQGVYSSNVTRHSLVE
jgi:uracil-DNA glycosylase